MAHRLVKCVVWDIDNTLLDGVYLESATAPPAANQAMAATLADLGSRGILHAIASKNPPQAAEHAAKVTGARFAAVECGWGAKSDALARIAADLSIGTDALAFVDDDPYERAEVGATLPEVLVLAPEEVAEAVGWPEFGAAAVTDEARRRGEMYAARRRRQAAERAFGGSRKEFLASAGTQVTIAAAGQQDAPLFGAGVSLDSLTGTLLLREVQRRFGVDVAGTDLNLDALATLGTLASFIAEQGGS